MTDVREPTAAGEPSRRLVLGGAAVIGAGAVLSACAGGDDPTDSTAATEPAAAPVDPNASVARVAEIPVGSGLIVASAQAVITQPAAGEFKAFNYTCTHKGCPVSKVTDDTISCTCHGSEFSTTDGSVTKGPATSALAELAVREKAGDLYLS